MGEFKNSGLRLAVLTVMLAVVTCAGCDVPVVTEESNDALPGDAVTKATPRGSSDKGISQSGIVDSNSQNYRWKEIRVSRARGNTGLEASETDDWAIVNCRELYKVSSEIVEKVNIERLLGPNECLNQIAYDGSRIWLTVAVNSGGPLVSEDLLISPDSGASWERRTLITSGWVAAIVYRFHEEIWVVGATSKEGDLVRGKPLLMVSTNGGRSWNDISSRISPQMDLSTNINELDDLVFTPDGSPRVITGKDEILVSEDGGETWQLVTNVPRGRSMGKRFLEANTGSVVLRVASDGKHGIGSGILEWNEKAGWTGYMLPKFYFLDVMLIPGGEVVACGSVSTGPEDDVNVYERQAVILHSNDRGKSWEITYQSDKAEHFEAIRKRPNGSFVAIANNGLVVESEVEDAIN